ncbi:dihydrodipicolinate synthase family protein [Roseibium salinum]|uniref:Dihydrodipicolinate synthase family protein n=1 Tax=Roseibium salinum TaxID=1604349 RepID=A0ABT3QX76_9HYPH|nr:dihydrodipicolinate synthase family protein [Roseibium sp. DSM 29163]MCX2721529.1 dihydrodipicolinate synthase family protein [Roseibium sp. DSM 29163]MDN3722002.1 dihydrodipicolinate synthase family protein [Roseibium salinum]
MQHTLSGIYPVVLTPFDAENHIDWDGYARLLDWYIEHGSSGLFAVCQSSEMQFLSLEERRDLSRFAVDHVNGRVPVVASGHVSESVEDQKAELRAIADTGVDAVVFVTNRFAGAGDPEGTLLARMQDMISALPGDMPLGLYECPAPYRRLLSDAEVKWCADSGRFAFLKDVACDLDTVKRRIDMTRGTPLAIINANAAIAWPVMQAGGLGFSGVMNNFHPDLYRWLYDHGADHPEMAEELQTFLVLSALSEAFGYPKLAKRFHKRIGTFASDHSRTVAYDLPERHWAIDVVVDRILEGAEQQRGRIASLKSAPAS